MINMKENVLVTRNLSKKYGDKYVVDKVNLTVNKGDIYGNIKRNN